MAEITEIARRAQVNRQTWALRMGVMVRAAFVALFALAAVVPVLLSGVGIHPGVTLLAKDRIWQQGYWRDTADARGPEGAVATTIGASVFVTPYADMYQTVVIESSDHVLYVAKRRVVAHGLKRHKPFPLTVNDLVTFAVDGLALYVRGVDPDDTSYEYRFDIVKRTRQP